MCKIIATSRRVRKTRVSLTDLRHVCYMPVYSQQLLIINDTNHDDNCQ